MTALLGKLLADHLKRERTKQKLRESEERYQNLAKIAPVGIFRTDKNGATTYVNPMWCQISGLSEAEAMGDGWLGAVHPDDREALSKGWQETIQRHKPSFADYRFLRPDGTVAWVMGQASPEMNSGKPNRRLCGHDHRHQRAQAAEEELKKSEGKFRAIFDNASDGMFIVDLKTKKFFMCNAMCAKMLGFAQEEFLNLDIADIHPGEDVPFINEQIGKFSRGEDGIRSEIKFKRKNGSIFAADLSPALLTIAEEKYLLIIFKDISERKRAEEMIRASLAEKEVLLKEVHHRVKNNLMTIIGLIKMEETKSKNKIFNALLLELEGRVRAMALVHESLHKSERPGPDRPAKLYRNADRPYSRPVRSGTRYPLLGAGGRGRGEPGFRRSLRTDPERTDQPTPTSTPSPVTNPVRRRRAVKSLSW